MMREKKFNLLLVLIPLILAFIFGWISIYIMKGYKDCRDYFYFFSCADDGRLALKDFFIFLTIICGALSIFLPIIIERRKEQNSKNEFDSIKIFPNQIQ